MANWLNSNNSPTPSWLTKFAPGEKAWEPMKGFRVPVPSGQLWNQTPSSQKAGLQSYINRFSGTVPGMVASYQDLIDRMLTMLPKSSPPRAGRWEPFRQ
jgi:hypothetical protein